MSGAPAPAAGEGTARALFWAAALAFALFDALAWFRGEVARWIPPDTLLAALPYLLLAAFAMAGAVVVGGLVGAVKARRAPPAGEGLRAAVALLLVLGHVALLVAVRLRG